MRTIVVLGASEAFGLYEQEGHEFPRELEQALQHAVAGSGVARQRSAPSEAASWQVVNAAYAGMQLSAMLPRVPELAGKVAPELALIYPTPANYIWLPWLTPTTTPPAPPREQLRAAENLLVLSKEVLPLHVQTYFRRRWIEREARRYGGVVARVPEENVRRFADDLRRLVEALIERAIEPVLITHVTRFAHGVEAGARAGVPVRLDPGDPERAWLTAWRKFYPMLDEDGFLDMEQRMNAEVLRLGVERGLLVVDAAATMPYGQTYFADFVHFTDQGAEKLGQLVAAVLAPRMQ